MKMFFFIVRGHSISGMHTVSWQRPVLFISLAKYYFPENYDTLYFGFLIFKIYPPALSFDSRSKNLKYFFCE